VVFRVNLPTIVIVVIFSSFLVPYLEVFRVQIF
jgi:hypothetical protein